MAEKHVDEVSGIETTGHEWDGLRELNNPLPRWWVWTFYASIIWAVVYWILMPSWPLISDYTKGIRGHSQRALVAEQVEALRSERNVLGEGIVEATLDEVQADPDLLQFAMASGRAAFGDNCSACHGTGATGFVGYPNLNDDDWLWGGTLEDIQYTIAHGIRNAQDPAARIGDMPAFPQLSRGDVSAVSQYVRSLSGLETEEGSDLEAGAEIYAANCAACHMPDGTGFQALGAPNLTDGIWLYGDSAEAIAEGVLNGRGAEMPAFGGRLDEATVKSLAVYVHSLGGGQ
ncbi:MAG: cytochrome-c oxidase, cbb3-type subunit III [Pseudomonadota bacterium]